MELYEDDTLLPMQEAEIIEEKILTEDITPPPIKLDYKLKSSEERAQLVQRIVEATPPEQLSNRYLEILGDYIMGALTKEEKRSKQYLTDNRLITINKRETSFEGLISKFENGEDGIYNLIADNRHILLCPKASITEEDARDIPGLSALQAAIRDIEAEAKAATGKRKYLLKKQLIEMRRDQYALKSIFKPTLTPAPSAVRGSNKVSLEGRQWLDRDNEPQSDALISFFIPEHISALLCNYNYLDIELRQKFQNDFYYLFEDFKALLRRSEQQLPDYYSDIIKLKIDGKSNQEIQDFLVKEHEVFHTVEYLSQLWRQRIPAAIADIAKEEFIEWYYAQHRPSHFKTCSRCKTLKPAHQRFFSVDAASKDGFYSMCKKCRNARIKDLKKKEKK